MSYTLSIATAETRDLVVDALRAAADQRTRVARGAARNVSVAKAAGKDVRSQAVKVTALLAEAGDLAELAEELAATTDLVIVATAPAVTKTDQAIAVAGEVLGVTMDPTDDDGTSAAAQAIADLAGLTPSDPDAVEDPVTGALPEDAPTEPVEVLA